MNFDEILGLTGGLIIASMLLYWVHRSNKKCNAINEEL